MPPHQPVTGLIAPPFVRQWTQRVANNTVIIAVQSGTIYYRNRYGIGALDLVSGEQKWHSLTGRPLDATLWANTIYALVEGTDEEPTTLVALDIPAKKTTRELQSRTLVSLPFPSQHLVHDARRLYVLDSTATLRAYAPRTGAVLWSRPLTTEKPPVDQLWSSAELFSTANGLYLDITSLGEFGVDPQSGKILWKHTVAESEGGCPLVLSGDDIVIQRDGIQRFNVRNGKVVWKINQGFGNPALLNDVVIANNETEFVGFRVQDGHPLWHLPLRDRESTSLYNWEGLPQISDGKSIWIDRKPFLCITQIGKEQWVQNKPFTGTPYFADAERLITMDGHSRLLCYRRGTLPPIPTEDAARKALAERQVAQFELLDNAERNQLAKLAPFTLSPLLRRYVQWTKDYAQNPSDDTNGGCYALLRAASPTLRTTFRRGSPEDTDALVSALAELREGWRSELEEILQEKGVPERYIPFFVRYLRQLPKHKRQESPALRAVAQSTHPAAVKFMLEALRDPAAAPSWRHEAFLHLAGTGGAAGIQAVRENRPRRKSLKPWYERVDFAKARRLPY